MKFNKRTSKKFLHIIDKYCALDLGRASSGPGGYGYVQSVMGYLGLALVFTWGGALQRGGGGLISIILWSLDTFLISPNFPRS